MTIVSSWGCISFVFQNVSKNYEVVFMKSRCIWNAFVVFVFQKLIFPIKKTIKNSLKTCKISLNWPLCPIEVVGPPEVPLLEAVLVVWPVERAHNRSRVALERCTGVLLAEAWKKVSIPVYMVLIGQQAFSVLLKVRKNWKANWRAEDSPKKRTDKFDLFAVKSKKANKTNSSVPFLGEVSRP